MWMLCLFHGQTTDVPDYELNLQPDETETAGSKDGVEDDTTAEKCKYYKMLIDAKADPDVVEPVGEERFHPAVIKAAQFLPH